MNLILYMRYYIAHEFDLYWPNILHYIAQESDSIMAKHVIYCP